MNNPLDKILQQSCEQMQLPLVQRTQKTMLDFLHFLQKWNKAYNLTAIDSLGKMLTHHLLDSLAVVPYLKGDAVLDIGTGAGFPGVPLALYYPEKKFVLLDSNGKKIRFLLQARSTFKIQNIEPEQVRVENFSATRSFDVIICRAVGKMETIVQQSRHLLAEHGRWMFMKGIYPQDELADLSEPFIVHKLSVPGLDASRHLVLVENRRE